jgi:hypothetical protein
MRSRSKAFFSEEKAEPALREPKDFCFSASGTIEAMAGTHTPAQT